MTKEYIIECFKYDTDILKYYDPTSSAKNNAEVGEEVYNKLLEYKQKYKCKFVELYCGYIFYISPKWFWQKRRLVSFCLKPKYRNREMAKFFWRQIVQKLGGHFTCCLFNKNTRAIGFLIQGGMKIKKTTDLLTLLSI